MKRTDDYRDNEWDDKWNSEEVQNDVLTTGISRDEWEHNEEIDKYGQDDYDDEF
ncbi:hypothetical protein NST11_17320 [Caldifermentibacillus hisashii]|jgi:hypothetical protein|uniref:hypothetical protein n=1 Tax=Caldifermentibacillus hisashii TaxID=996558 RepID=UPI0031018C55